MKVFDIHNVRRLILVAIASVCLFASCRNTGGQATDNTQYKTMTLGLSDKVLEENHTAVIRGKQNVEIRPQISGTITEILINEGAVVRKGQVLFVIDQIPYQAALKSAVANMRNAEAKLATAKLTAESNEALYRENVISDFELQTAKNALLEAEAVLAQAEAQKSNAENDLSYTVIKSPVDGVASMIPYRVGALVNPSITQPLVTVSDDNDVYAYFSMTENQMLNLTQLYGSLDNVLQNMPEAKLQLSNGTMYAHTGKVDAISGTIDPNTGAISVRTVFLNPEKLLRNGSTGQVVLSAIVKDCIIIPQAATYELQNKVFAWKVVDNKAQSVAIEVQSVNDGKEYIVKSGLKAGDIIIAEGAGLVREGTVVSTSPENNR